MTEWVVCNICHNVIQRHDCRFGARRQPWLHHPGYCPDANRRQFNDRPCAYCGRTIRHSPAATAAPTSQEGGETIMENITVTIDGVEYNLVPAAAATAAAPRTLTIKRPHVVYDVDGNRVDGYKYESRARRNNDERFAGVGYWLGNANTGDFQFVSA